MSRLQKRLNNCSVYWLHQPARRTIGYTKKKKEIFGLAETWACQWTYYGRQRFLTVPAGYIWDGASIPRIAWTLLGLTPSGIMDGPSLMHDLSYRASGGAVIEKLQGARITNENGNSVIVRRPEVDAVIQVSMLFAGIDKKKAVAVYPIVRVFGRQHWSGPMPAMK